jgi:hypothetical protein
MMDLGLKVFSKAEKKVLCGGSKGPQTLCVLPLLKQRLLYRAAYTLK